MNAIESNIQQVEGVQNNLVVSDKDRNEVDSQSNHRNIGLSSFDVWAMGITTVIGGQYFSWNFGLTAGFGSFAIASFLIGFAYISLVFCICEITGALPFSGGSYGLARCTQGNYFGFLLGCLEAIEYIFYVASSFNFLGVMITLIEPQTIGYEPIIWLILYIFSLTIYIFGGKLFWHFNTFLAIISTLILLMFSFGSLHNVNFNKYAAIINSEGSDEWFAGGMHEFMKVLPLAAWFFVGVESLKMMCDEMPKDVASVQVPRGQISCMLTLFVTMVLVLFITPSLPPGTSYLISNLVPFNAGFQLMFGLTSAQTIKYATILSIPATFATSFGFILMYGKIISSMANSKLLPFFLSYRCSKTGSPYAALLFGSLLSYSCSIVVFFNSYFGLQLFNICILSAFLAYICQIIGYIHMNKKFSLVRRTFVSPFGLWGAYFSLLIWMFGIISVIAFQDNSDFALIVLVIIVSLLSTWYFAVAKKQQSFSEEERSIFFTLHVINHNLSSKKRRSVSHSNSFIIRTGNVIGAAVGSLTSSKSNHSSGGSNGNNRRIMSQESSIEKPSQKSQKLSPIEINNNKNNSNNITDNIKTNTTSNVSNSNSINDNSSSSDTKTNAGFAFLGGLNIDMINNKKSKIRVGIEQQSHQQSLLTDILPQYIDTSPSTIDSISSNYINNIIAINDKINNNHNHNPYDNKVSSILENVINSSTCKSNSSEELGEKKV